jgi:hypothetical protein
MPTPTTTLIPRTGRMFARDRLVMGLSARAVSAELRVPHSTLLAWEASAAPLPTERADRWEIALRTAAAKRAVLLLRHGFDPRRDLHGTDVGRTFTLYTR